MGRHLVLLTRIAPLLAAVALMAAPGAADGQPLTAGEDEVKAAFLYRFGSFVEWPPEAFANGDSPFVLVIAGSDEVATHLETLTAERTMNGRTVVVRRVARGEEVGQAHVLFIGRDARRAFDSLVGMVFGSPVLVITEVEGGVMQGSMIDLVIDAERVRFDVAPDAAAAQGLKISSRVLAIARQVAKAG